MTIESPEKVPYITTPLVEAELSHKTPCSVYLKQEFIQKTGSYKVRGLSYHIKKELESIKKSGTEKEVVVVAASGGNAGLAVSYSSKFYNLNSIIVVPTKASVKIIKKIESNGSKIILNGDNIGEADEFARNQVMKRLNSNQIAIYCHPYDLPHIWEGHSSLVDEIVSQLTLNSKLGNLKGIVCSIGGGGLYNGLVEGLERNKLSSIPILTIETDSVPTFNEAIIANSPVQLTSFNSIATSLACPYISSKSLENYNIHRTRNILVTDSEAANSCLKFANDSNIIVEPACGVALCSIYNDLLAKNSDFFNGLEKDDIIVVIVCGGSSTTIDDLNNYEKIYQL